MASANFARYGRSIKLSARFVKIAGLSLSLAILTATVPLRAQSLPAFTPVSEVPAKQPDGDSIPARESALKIKLAEVNERLLALAKDDSAKPGVTDVSEWTEYKA